mgnify:CR=1 FL=1
MNFQENEAVNYFDQSISDYKQGSSRIRKHLPNVVQGYFDFTEACFEKGEISEKHKQLIALAISIYARDEYCIMYHSKGAVEHGATDEEIMETSAVCAALGGGTAFSEGVTLAIDTYDHYQQQIH